MNVARSRGFVQTRSGVVGESTLRSVTIRTSFALDDGSMAPGVLRTEAGWSLQREGDVVVAKIRGGRYLVPLSNIPGMSDPPPPPPAATTSDDVAITSATKRAAEEAAVRSRGRSARR